MAWNKRVTVALLAIVLVLPAPFELGGSWVGHVQANNGSDVTDNESISNPAFLYLNLVWSDGAGRFQTLPISDFKITILGNLVSFEAVSSNPIPVESGTLIGVKIYARNGYPDSQLFYINYTSGGAGSYRVLTIPFTTADLARGQFMPARVLFRPYDSTTGAGLPIEQFNITTQFGAQQVFGCTGNCIDAGPEFPIAGGYIDTFYGVNITIRARDYFGNLLYNQTRLLRWDNSTFCNHITGGTPEECTPFTANFVIWDIPLTVYSFKVYNQKPDQFIKVKLFWNGTGAGEEVYAPNSGLFPDWWNAGYTYRNRLVVNTSTGLNTSFDYNMSFDVAPYVSAGKVQADLRDLRVVYYNFTSMAWKEVNRSYNTTTGRLYFKAAAWLALGSSDRGYFIYYGSALAGAAPSFTPYRTLVLSTSGTTAYWPMDETSGSTFVDISGHGNNCGINGAPTLGVQGEIAKAVDWGDTNGRRCNANPLTTSTFTIDGWYKGTSTPAQSREIVSDHWGSADWNFRVALTTSNTINIDVRAGTSSGTFTAATAIVNGFWYHLAFSYDGTNIRIYVNGTLDAGSATATGTFPHITQQIVFAYEGFSDRGLPGSEDEWAFTTRALSGAEILARAQEGIGQNGTATAAVESANAFQWFQSPTETVERFLNPGYYELQIVTDNRTGIQTKANLGVNITEANYYMVSGTNITRFIGDFNSIYSQTQIIANAFRPDIIAYGEQLPTAPTQIKPMSIDGEAVLHDPFSVLTGSTAYTGAAGTNVTSYEPSLSSESSNDGSMLSTITVTKDQFIFSGAEPALTHIWINYTSNGTNIWESSTLPPSITLSGIQGDVFVVTNRTAQTTRISDFRAVWIFSVAFYPTTKRYEVALSLNNTMNRTVYNPYWFVAFPENTSINMTSAAVKDLDNNVWLTKGQHYEVAQGGYYMTFDGLNASSVRHFFFQYFAANSTAGQSTLIRQVSLISQSEYKGSTVWWLGTASFSHEFTAPYNGDLVIKFTCPECTRIRWETVEVVDEANQRKLDPTEFLAGGGSVTISAPAVGELGVGAVRTYSVHFQMTLSPETSGFSIFAPFIVIAGVGLTVFLLMFGWTIVSVVMAVWTDGRDRRSFWTASFSIVGLLTLLAWIGRAKTAGGLGFVP